MALNDEPPFGPVVNGTMVVVFWEYRPSHAAAYLFLALFALATLGHLIYFAWLRAWTFIPFILGGVCQVFGYLERARAHDEPDKLDPWLLQNMMLLVAPPLLAATVYMSYGRVSAALLTGVSARAGRDKRGRGCCARCCYACWCRCSPTRAYVLVDVVAIFTQLIGTVLPASGTAEAQRLSKIVVLVGLFAQLAALAVFSIACGRLHARLRRDPSASRAMLADPRVHWLRHFSALEIAAAMLIVRSVMRGAEYLGGTDGVVASHEAFIFVFDALPMLATMIVFLLLHPSRLLREVACLERRIKPAEEFTELRAARRGRDVRVGNVRIGTASPEMLNSGVASQCDKFVYAPSVPNRFMS